MKEFFSKVFLHDASNFDVRKISHKIILHYILDTYPRISFINKGLSIVQILHVRCDKLKVICSGIERSGRILHIDDNIIISSNPLLYDMLCLC